MSARIFILLGAATLPASFGLLQDGFFSSSDGMIHLYRLFELDRVLHAGILFPRWFPLSGYGYGLPVLNYYPPLAYYLPELFHLFGAGFIVAIKLLIAIGFVVAAHSMFLFARDLLGIAPAFVAGIAFAYLPYLLSDAYIRGNFPEFLAMSLIPLALFALRKLYATRSRGPFILAATSFAAIILSHHLTAMLFAPLVIVYLLLLFLSQRDFKNLMTCSAAILVALALSAFYWVPAIAELNLVFVDPASLPRFLVSRLVSVAEFFAPSLEYAYLPQSEALLHSAGFPQTMIALLAILIVIVSHLPWPAVPGLRGALATQQLPALRREGFAEGAESAVTHVHAIFFFLILIASIFMVLNLSAPLWYAIPPLRFMQFPWRFQVLAGISIAFLIGVWAIQIQRITNHPLRQISFATTCLALIGLATINLPVRTISLTDAQLYLSHSDDPTYVVAQMGWSWTREFVPASVQEDTVIGQKVRLGPLDSMRMTPWVQIESDSLLSQTARVSTQEPFQLSLHTFFYPGWQAYIDNVAAQTFAQGELGLATVNVPPGDHVVTFRFEEMPFRLAMDLVSALTLLIGIVWFGVAHRRAIIAVGVAMIFLAAIFLVHTRAAPATTLPISLDANFENRALLIGFSTERADQAAYVKLYWLALTVMDRDYVSFVHLVGADGELVAQDDSITDQGVTPTSRWQVGEIVTDRHALPLTSLRQGDYRLVAGLYLPRDSGYTNVIAFDRAGDKIGNQVELGQMKLVK